MAEVLSEYSSVVMGEGGTRYHAHACGAPMPDGRWQAWIEFIPFDGGEPVRSGRETTQPNRADAIYWATGVTPIYLDGALQRALAPPSAPRMPADAPVFDGPQERVRDLAPEAAVRAPVDADAVLDPFSVYAKGEDLLRKQLGALSAWHLVNIIRTYALSDEAPAALNRVSAPELIERIVNGVAGVAGSRAAR